MSWSGDHSLEHLPASVAGPILEISKSVGVPSDQFRLLLCLLMSIPFGLLHQKLPGAVIKHVYSALLGFGYCWLVVGPQTLEMVASALIVWVVCRIFKNNKSMPLWVTGLTMAHLSYNHIYVMWHHWLGWDLDITLIEMIFCVKASMYAFNVSDGAILAKKESLSPIKKVHEHRAARALVEYPNLLEYFSFIFFYGAVLVGPVFEMQSYLDFTSLNYLKKHGLKQQPPVGMAIVKPFIYAIICYGGVIIHGMLPIFGVVTTTEWISNPFLWRIGYIFISIVGVRCKYYFAWYLAESGCNACGFGFSGKNQATGDLEWEHMGNVRALSVETGHNLPALTNNWNRGVNNWAKYYIFFRVPQIFKPKYSDGDSPERIEKMKKKAKGQNLLVQHVVTKAMVAFWHGFYPAYYVFFGSAVLINMWDNSMKALIEKTKPGFKNSIPHRIIGWILTFLVMNYLGLAFVVLSADNIFVVFKSFYYYGHILCVILIFVLNFLNKSASRKQKDN